jgi:hypothetical protein
MCKISLGSGRLCSKIWRAVYRLYTKIMYYVLSLVWTNLSVFQIPFYRGERITFDVAPSRMDFRVEHNSLRLEVSLQCSIFLLGCYLWVKIVQHWPLSCD